MLFFLMEKINTDIIIFLEGSIADNIIKEFKMEQILIEQEIDNAVIDGYVSSLKKENIGNWLSEYGDPDNVLSWLKEKEIENVAVLKNIYVPEENRSNGIGGELLEYFINEAFNNSAQAILLEVDVSEDNDFSLKDWYLDYGFESLPVRIKCDEFENIMILINDENEIF